MKRSYQTDLTDAVWKALQPHLPTANKRGRPTIHSPREILNAVFFYILKSGCPWRLLPREFPPWEILYRWFRKWKMDGTFEQLNASLRELLRARTGRNPLPGAGVADSQTTKTTGVGGEQREDTTPTRGFGAGKGTCSWTRSAWCSKPRCTARR